MLRGLAFVVVASVLGQVVGCGGGSADEWALKDRDGTKGADAGDASLPGVGQNERDASPEPPRPVPDGAIEPPAPPAPEGCAIERPDATKGVFVTKTGTGSACTAQAPCGAIQAALSVAIQQGRSIVYVAAGTYVEQVTLDAPVTLRGGWLAQPGEWVRDCSGTRIQSTVIQAPATANKTVIAKLTGNAAFDTLTIASRDSAAKAGESIYGIVATGALTRVELVDVAVRVIAGGDGAPGASGAVGGTGRSACELTLAGTGAIGGKGGGGAGAAAGSFSEGGYQPASGTAGVAGGVGQNGIKGGADQPQCLLGVAGCGLDGMGGFGCSEKPYSVCGTRATLGCGGGGGTGGAPGTSGGNSIALYAWAAKASIVGGSFTTGDGGRGGNGGAGGAGGVGGSGVAGPSGQLSVIISCSGVGMACENAHGAYPTGAPAGGRGGAGGAGGDGGGGAGGSSFGYYAGGAATVTTSGTTVTRGAAGAAGSGGTPGTPGLSADSN